jgi:hypothetical protein
MNGFARVTEELGSRIRGMSARDRRALVIGLALLVPALAWIGLVRPYVDTLHELQDRVASEQALLEREKAIMREAHTFPERIAGARQALRRWDASFVTSANLALAEAEITGWLEEIARENRLLLEEVRSVARPPGATAPSGLKPLRLSVRGESDFEGVLRFLHAMERDPMLVRIVGLSVERAGRAGSEGEGNGAQPGAMAFIAVIEAFTPDGVVGSD